MLDNVLRIATRQSPLALWQVHYVKDKLVTSHPGLVIELIPMVTRGDMILDTPLAKIGGRGLFVKELEVAFFEDRAGIAVHSMKDVPVELLQGLGLVTICEHEGPRDAFVSNSYDSLDALPAGDIVGVSSLRRRCQLAERRPNLIIRSLRGNVGTRLNKLNDGEYGVIILAVTELKRLDLGSRIRAVLSPEISLPVTERSTVGIECRLDGSRTRELLVALNHHEAVLCVTVERAMNTRLEGGCRVPIGSYAELIGGEVWLRTPIDAPDGSQIIRGEHRGAPQDAEQMGTSLAEKLLNNGAREILAEVYNRDTPA